MRKTLTLAGMLLAYLLAFIATYQPHVQVGRLPSGTCHDVETTDGALWCVGLPHDTWRGYEVAGRTVWVSFWESTWR